MSTLSPAVHLLFPLVAGETRLVIPLEETVLSAALKPASDRSQRLIVFVHGAASNASRWEEFVDTTALSQRWTLVRFDLRGQKCTALRRQNGGDEGRFSRVHNDCRLHRNLWRGF